MDTSTNHLVAQSPLAARSVRARTRGNVPPSRAEAETYRAHKERIGRDIGAAMLAELDIWAVRAELLHDETLAAVETGHAGNGSGTASDTLDALMEAFGDMPVLPPGALAGSPLLQDDGALSFASALWPALIPPTATRGELEESNLVCVIETAFHIARVALVAGLADLTKQPGAAGALELLQCAAAVASRIIEPNADGQAA